MTSVEPLDNHPSDPNNISEFAYWYSYAKTQEKTIKILRCLIEDYLPQIGMNIHFRELFYKIVGEPYPEWFEIPPWTRLELEWRKEKLQSSKPKVIE